jgi:hypothetical protein
VSPSNDTISLMHCSSQDWRSSGRSIEAAGQRVGALPEKEIELALERATILANVPDVFALLCEIIDFLRQSPRRACRPSQ